MVWASHEEEAMSIVGQHMGVMRVEKKPKLQELYLQLIFSCQGQGWDHVPWMTHWGVTYMTMWDEEHLLKNIQFAMIQEMMGIRLERYCIVDNIMQTLRKN